jgi:protein SCO1/2
MMHAFTPRTVRRPASIALLLLLVLLGATACSRRDTSRPAATAATAATAAAAATTTVRAESFSVYDLPGTWRDQTGATRTLESLRGAPVLLTMAYTHCTATCPLAVAELKRIAGAHRDARLVIVSLDPARDDPARLAAYARELGLDTARWTLLTGTDADVRELAATLGVRYRRVTPEDLAHSNLITLLDRDGRMVRQASGRMDDAAIAALR